MVIQSKVSSVDRYYESLEEWDKEFSKVLSTYSQQVPTIGEESFLWSGLLAKSQLRQLLDELYEHAL